MPKVIDKIEVCEDCLMPIMYGDFTGLDYYYSPEEADARADEIEAGMDRLSERGALVNSDLHGAEFSKFPCQCCGSKLHGRRHAIAIIN